MIEHCESAMVCSAFLLVMCNVHAAKFRRYIWVKKNTSI